MTARVLNILGLDIGPDDDLLPADRHNPKGYWENRDVVDLNERILAKRGGSWDNPPPFPPGWENDADLADLRSEAEEHLARLFPANTKCVIKDPRLSLTLPFWNAIYPVAGVVVPVRDPAEVAASLESRDGYSTIKSDALWIRYLASVFANSPRTLVIKYADFFERLELVCANLADFVGVPGPTDSVLAIAAEFLDKSLNRYGGSVSEKDASIPNMLSDHLDAPTRNQLFNAAAAFADSVLEMDRTQRHLQRIAAQLEETKDNLAKAQDELAAIRATTTWRIARRVIGFADRPGTLRYGFLRLLRRPLRFLAREKKP